VPTVRAVAQFATTLKPTTETLDIAIDDTLGVVEGWARSIQNRDGIGHVFRGRFSGGADLVKAVLSESLAPSRRGRRQRPGRPQTVAPPTSAPATPAPGRLPALKTPVLSIGGIKLPAIDVTGTVDKTTQDVTGLLDYLLKP
jgi:hypothetical protein